MNTARSWPVRIIAGEEASERLRAEKEADCERRQNGEETGPMSSFCAVEVQMSTTRP